jgi:hypothetical protein
MRKAVDSDRFSHPPPTDPRKAVHRAEPGPGSPDRMGGMVKQAGRQSVTSSTRSAHEIGSIP